MDHDEADPATRIEAALTRIETAIAAHTAAGERLAARHTALRAHMAEAVKALDDLLAQGTD